MAAAIVKVIHFLAHKQEWKKVPSHSQYTQATQEDGTMIPVVI